MLIRFAVENYKSFKDQQVFSMVAGKYTRHASHICDLNGKKVLKGSFFFGANAAGKTNLIDAIAYGKEVAIKGLRNVTTSNRHFRIDSAYVKKPGVFQFDIYSNGHYYSYGFAISYDKSAFEEEWLYLWTEKEYRIFERTIQKDENIIEFDFDASKEEKAAFKLFADNVPKEKSLLMEIAERKLSRSYAFKPFCDVVDWFNRLLIIRPNSKFLDKEHFFDNEKSFANLLKGFDTGIEEVELQDVNDDYDLLPQEERDKIIDDVERKTNKNSTNVNRTIHIKKNNRSLVLDKEDNDYVLKHLVMNHGNYVDMFELEDESDGTQRLFDLIPIYDAALEPKVILVDELDRSFHTKLVEKFITNFYENTRSIPSQLIASVHDSNVMDLDLLRQDEIWFIERDADHSSKLYPLSKFKERFDKKIGKDYLLGRYGAIPCFNQLELSTGDNK